MRKIILVIIVASLGLSVVFAQGGRKGHRHHHPKLNKEAKAALHAFHKEEIFPVKKEAHDQFLANLTEKDRAFLDQKRVEEKALHEEMSAVRKEMKGLRTSGKSREEMHEIHKEKLEPLREKHRNFMESMKPFMEQNETLIKISMKPMKENRETWKNKKDAILEQYLSEAEKTELETCKKERAERSEHRGENHGSQKGKEQDRESAKGEKRHHGRIKGAVQFVLWDGIMHEPKENQTNTVKNSSSSTAIEKLTQTTGFTINTYPNPAISQTTILLNLVEESKKVKVSVTNTEGQQVWVKNYNKLTKGEHQVDVNLQKLVSGQYFYTVEIGEERVTKSFVINK